MIVIKGISSLIIGINKEKIRIRTKAKDKRHLGGKIPNTCREWNKKTKPHCPKLRVARETRV